MTEYAKPCPKCLMLYPGDCYHDGCKDIECRCDGCLDYFQIEDEWEE